MYIMFDSIGKGFIFYTVMGIFKIAFFIFKSIIWLFVLTFAGMFRRLIKKDKKTTKEKYSETNTVGVGI